MMDSLVIGSPKPAKGRHGYEENPRCSQTSPRLTQEFNAFDISSNPTWLGTADVTAAFTFLPPASSGPITGDLTGVFSLGWITWDNGGTTTVNDSDGNTYTLTLENTLYTQCFDDVEGKLTQVPEPASIAMLGSGLLGLAGFARRRFSK